MTLLRASGGGRLEDDWEKRILCSNSRHSKKDSACDGGKVAKRSLKEVGLIAAEVVAIASLTTMVQQPEQVAMLQCRQDDARAEDDLLKYQTPSGIKGH